MDMCPAAPTGLAGFSCSIIPKEEGGYYRGLCIQKQETYDYKGKEWRNTGYEEEQTDTFLMK